MKTFSNSGGKSIVMNMIKAIQKNRDYLSEIDGAIGDGDHGINMNKGFTICEAEIKNRDLSFGEALGTLGGTLFNEIGGSMGPIYGLLFSEMGNSLIGRETIDEDAFYEMLRSGITGVKDIVTAEVGDKTLMDALLPAADAFRKAADEGKGFEQSLQAMKNAAAAGRDATADMVAKLGRACRLGERSKGTPDPGAASCAILLAEMADSITGLLH